MSGRVGCARCSPDEQDLTAQPEILIGPDVPEDRIAELEVDLLRMRTREGTAVARAEGKLKGKQPELGARQQSRLVQQHQSGGHTIADLAELFSVDRATGHRVLERHQEASVPSNPGGQ